ncbi:MAG: hypothetical protein KAR06_04350 [Deltaproteobacteria bacterium]|nr:hypothetical protein [Deltaproteobacteria bacterium]
MIFITSEENKHTHLVYMRPDGTGTASKVNDHSHTVQFIPPQEALTDEFGGIIQEAQPERYEVSTDGEGKKAHKHDDIQDFEGTKKDKDKEKEEETKTYADIKRLFKAAMEYEKEPRIKALASEGYYSGEGHWEEDAKKKLEGEKRPVLTINEIEPKMDILDGYQRNNRFDLHFFPIEGGDGRVADILNVIVKVTFDQNDFDSEESEVCDDQRIAGRGVFNMYIDYEKNIEGEIVIEQYPWEDAYFGPHKKKDLKDCEYLCKTTWYSGPKIKQLWPEKADEIGKEFETTETEESNISTNIPGEEYTHPEKIETIVPLLSDPELVSVIRKEYRIIECWQKEYHRVPVIVNIEDEFYFNASNWSKEEVKEIETIPSIDVAYSKVDKMRVTTIGGGKVLKDEYPDLARDEFHMFPIYAKKRGSRFWGKIEPVKGMQDEINKRHSQVADIVNRVASYGWWYDAETFASPTDEKRFTEQGSRPGVKIKVADLSKVPQKMDGIKFPNEVVALEALASDKLAAIMNVIPEMQGQTTRAESGIAILEKKKAGLVGNEFLFDNLSLGKKRLGRLLVAMLQKVMTPSRLLRILQTRAMQGTIDIAGRPFNPGGSFEDGDNAYTVEELEELLDNVDLTKYDVAIGESAQNATTRRANFLIIADLAGKGLPIPPNVLLELSDIPNKAKITKQIEQMQQQAAQAEQGKQNTEIEKTKIAAGAKAGGAPSPGAPR